MQTQLDQTHKSQRLSTARRLLTNPSRAGQGLTVPRNATPGVKFIAAARNYRRCAGEYIKAVGAWQTFTATHPHDDPAHEEHQRRVVSARQALNGADEAFALADAAAL